MTDPAPRETAAPVDPPLESHARGASASPGVDVFLVDVGNTRIKLSRWYAGRVEPLASHPTAAVESAVDAFRPHLGAPADDTTGGSVRRAAISSVHPAALDKLVRGLAESGIEPRWICRSDGGLFRSGLLMHNVETPDTIGVDRLLGLLAASSLHPSRPVITVDVGSALTVNLGDASGRFLGGLIMPGYRLAARALAAGTAALPEVTATGAEPFPARSTAAALRLGVRTTVAGGAERALRFARAAFRELPRHAGDELAQPAVILTGGDAATLRSDLADDGLAQIDVVPDLVLRGLVELVRRRPGGFPE